MYPFFTNEGQGSQGGLKPSGILGRRGLLPAWVWEIGGFAYEIICKPPVSPVTLAFPKRWLGCPVVLLSRVRLMPNSDPSVERLFGLQKSTYRVRTRSGRCDLVPRCPVGPVYESCQILIRRFNGRSGCRKVRIVSHTVSLTGYRAALSLPVPCTCPVKF